MGELSVRAPEPFDSRRHRVDRFSCGAPQLDAWLRASAGQGQRRDAARTFVAVAGDDEVVAYYTLVAGQVAHDDATAAVRKGMSKHFPIPVALLARLAVGKSRQGEGLGAALLADAIRRVVRAADDVAIRALIVDALDERAAGFYERFGFQRTIDALTLMAPVAQLRMAVPQAG